MSLDGVIDKIRESLPVILIADGQNKIVGKGSGFIYQKQDIVVTCAHVVGGAEGVSVNLQFPDDRETFLPAKVVITDHEHDIALLKFEPNKSRSPLKLSNDEAKEGMSVIFSGYPFEFMDLTTHQGIISSIVTDPTGMKSYLIDGTVNPGNSGGPLMNLAGEVVGVINATRRNNANLLGRVQSMPVGALSLHGIDIVELYGALVDNLQLGVGHAVPSSYIPVHTDETTNRPNTKKETKS